LLELWPAKVPQWVVKFEDLRAEVGCGFEGWLGFLEVPTKYFEKCPVLPPPT